MKSNLMFLKHKPFSYLLILLVVSHIGTSVVFTQSVCENPDHLARMQDLQ